VVANQGRSRRARCRPPLGNALDAGDKTVSGEPCQRGPVGAGGAEEERRRHPPATMVPEAARPVANRCILKSQPMVRKIIAALGLPRGTKAARDSHYKCAVCMVKVPTRKQEAEDWDFC